MGFCSLIQRTGGRKKGIIVLSMKIREAWKSNPHLSWVGEIWKATEQWQMDMGRGIFYIQREKTHKKCKERARQKKKKKSNRNSAGNLGNNGIKPGVYKGGTVPGTLESLWPSPELESPRNPSLSGTLHPFLAQYLTKTHSQLFLGPIPEHNPSPPREHPGGSRRGAVGWTLPAAREGFHHPKSYPSSQGCSSSCTQPCWYFLSATLHLPSPLSGGFLWSWTIRVVCVPLIMRPLLCRDSWYYSSINSVIIEIRELKFWWCVTRGEENQAICNSRKLD